MQPFEIRKKDETINQRIARYRKAVGYSQKEMADFLGEKHSTYAQKERCGTIDCDTLIKISYILGMDINIFLYGENSEEEVVNILRFVTTPQEKQLIKVLRQLKPKQRDLVYELVGFLVNSK